MSDLGVSTDPTPGGGFPCLIAVGALVLAGLGVLVGVSQLVHLIVWLAAVTHLSDWAGPVGIVVAGLLFGALWVRLDSTVDGES